MVLMQISIILGGRVRPHFLEWEDGPPRYKYTRSEILLGPHFLDQSYATAVAAMGRISDRVISKAL